MNKTYSLLGFAQRSKKLVSGEEGVEGAIRRGKAQFLIIAQDCSKNTQSRFISMAKANAVEHCLFGTKDDLGKAVGKAQRAVVAIVDRPFSRAVKESMKEYVGEKN